MAIPLPLLRYPIGPTVHFNVLSLIIDWTATPLTMQSYAVSERPDLILPTALCEEWPFGIDSSNRALPCTDETIAATTRSKADLDPWE